MISKIIKAGDLLRSGGADSLVDSIALEGLTTLDFDGIDEISFSLMRKLFNRRKAGAGFSIVNASDAVACRFEDSGVSNFINVTRKPAPLDISRYSMFGEGYLSKAYNSQDGDSMLKMYGANMPEEVVVREKNVAKAVLQFGINTPMVGTMYDYQGNRGLDFERIEGKRSFSRIMSEEPRRIEEMSVRFARMCRNLHDTPCDTTIFADRSLIYRSVVSSSKDIDGAQKAKVLSFLDSVPHATTCLHGDLQPSNVITDGKEDYWIDLSDFGYGYPMLDLGMWYFLSNLNTEELSMHIFHLGKAQMAEIWNIFVREYFGALTPADLEEVRRKVEPFAALHMLYIGTLYGFRPGMLDFIGRTLF